MKEINLIKSLGKKDEKISSKSIVLILVLFITTLIIIYIFILAKHLVHISQEKLYAEKQHNLQSELTSIQKKYPLIAKETSLAKKNDELRKALRTKEKKWHKMSKDTLQSGFSSVLSGISETIPKTAWINKLNINFIDSECMLHGYATTSNTAAIFLKNIRNKSVFDNCKIQFAHIHKAQKSKINFFEFSLNSTEGTIDNTNDDTHDEEQ